MIGYPNLELNWEKWKNLERAKQSAFRLIERKISDRENLGNRTRNSPNLSRRTEKSGHSSGDWVMKSSFEQSVSKAWQVMPLSRILDIVHNKASISECRGDIHRLCLRAHSSNKWSFWPQNHPRHEVGSDYFHEPSTWQRGNMGSCVNEKLTSSIYGGRIWASLQAQEFETLLSNYINHVT